MVEANWSGSYPCLCCGEWTLIVDGKNVSNKIPKELRNSSMDTLGVYDEWHFEDWLEVFTSYSDGLDCNKWIKKNKYWLDTITTNEDTQNLIFLQIQKNDFRSGSCGGCI